jgi:ribonuclease Y
MTQKNFPALPGYLETTEEQARRLLAIVAARQATRWVSEYSTSRVPLSATQIKDGIKGKIVGKDGRNSRYFEEKAGVDLILNEIPDAVIISSFDAFRREVARAALDILIRDGRIQAPRIDEALQEAKIKVDLEVREAGARAAAQLGIEGLHPAIVRVLGTLRFRQSFGQNQLDHSVETAWLAGNLASELGFDSAIARRAGLLHDLGKALDQTHDGGHAKAGAEFADRYGESAEVVKAIATHHEELAPESWLDHLVIAADALSGARPGARHASTQTSLDRAEAIEKIALSFPGVTASFAVQAGRELRVFVDSEKIQDAQVQQLARQIADEIVAQQQFPGQIKVTVLREIRVVEVASR